MTGYRYAAAPGYVSPCQPSRSAISPITPRGTYPYLPHNATPVELEAHNLRGANEMDTRHRSLLRSPQTSNSRRSKSQTPRREGSSGEANGFLRVQTPPAYHRRTLSHSSRSAPSLTHSSDNESEGRPVSGPSTPHTPNPSLWTDNVSVVSDTTHRFVPPPSAAAPNLKTQYAYGTHTPHYSAKPPTLFIPPTPSFSRASGLTESEKARAEIEAIDSNVQSRASAFTFPDTLDVEWQPRGEAPSPLSYTTRNKELIRHRGYLEESLSQLNAIRSHGDTHVRDTRRGVAKKIRGQIDNLNRMEKMVRDNIHYERWKKQQTVPRIEVTAPAEVWG